MTAHWGVPDPAAVEGSDEQKAKAFMDAAITLKRRIELMLALPWIAGRHVAAARARPDRQGRLNPVRVPQPSFQ